MKRRLIPALIVLALVGLLIYQLTAQAQVQCHVCVIFKGARKCATATATEKPQAVEEAHRSACSLMARGVSEAFACPQTPPDEVNCKAL